MQKSNSQWCKWNKYPALNMRKKESQRQKRPEDRLMYYENSANGDINQCHFEWQQKTFQTTVQAQSRSVIQIRCTSVSQWWISCAATIRLQAYYGECRSESSSHPIIYNVAFHSGLPLQQIRGSVQHYTCSRTISTFRPVLMEVWTTCCEPEMNRE